MGSTESAASEGAAVLMTLSAMLSLQLGAALAIGLFDQASPAAVVLGRSLFAAAILVAIGRRGLRNLRLSDAVVFGAILAGMNLSFYAALDHLPLGAVVTLEFVGPLAIAVYSSRRPRDLIWVALALAGILLLSDGLDQVGADPAGIALALLSGGFWGAYIVQSARLGREPGLGGLAVAVSISALLVLPFGLAAGVGNLLAPGPLLVLLAVALLNSAFPYALELQALRHIPKGVYSVLMSLQPAVAALVGFLVLAQALSAQEMFAIALVVGASIGALRSTLAPRGESGAPGPP